MAKKTYTVTELTDDLDGGKADRTVTFSFAGTNYEIDLSKKNASAFEKAFATYVAAARKVPRAARSRRAARTGRTGSRSDLAEIRSWAKKNGRAVSERGRIPKSVQDAYDAVH